MLQIAKDHGIDPSNFDIYLSWDDDSDKDNEYGYTKRV